VTTITSQVCVPGLYYDGLYPKCVSYMMLLLIFFVNLKFNYLMLPFVNAGFWQVYTLELSVSGTTNLRYVIDCL
jgi:hypothetical protein